ncbi:MAG: O-antigen ligase family protein [Bacteroidales bacterium]
MKLNKTSFFHVGFAMVLLLIVNTIRSGVLVDTSFLPRFFLLAANLLVATLLLFRKRISLPFSWFLVTFLLLYCWNLLSTTWAIVPSEAIAQAQLVFVSFATYLIIRILTVRDNHFEKIFITISLVALLFSFLLAFYKMSRLEFFDPYRIISVSANNNLYSGYLLISLPLTFAGYSIFHGLRKYLSALTGILAVFFIIITQSRAVYLGLAFSSLLFMTILLMRYRAHFNRKNLLVGALSLLLLLAGISAFYTSLDQPRKNYFLSKIPVWQYFRSYDKGLNDLVEKRKKEKAELTGIPEFDFAGSYYENANLRMIFWKKSAGLVASHPLLGVGAGNWRIHVASIPKPDNPDHIFKNYTYSQPHNEWIGFASELGIPGLILVIILFFLPVILVFFRIVVRREKLPVTTLFYASFIAGFYLFACFDFPLKRIEHSVILFSILAFIPLEIPRSGWFQPSSERAWKYLRFFLVIGLMFTSVVAFMRIKGEFFTLKMFRNERMSPENVIRYGKEAGNRFYRLTPNTLPVDWFIGVAQFKLGDAASARMSFQKALKVTPYEVRVLNDDATALYQLGKAPEAKVEWQQALEIDPFFDDARFNLAALHYFNGKYDSAFLLVKACRESQKRRDFLEELEKVQRYPQ